jgi:hypothetical protein
MIVYFLFCLSTETDPIFKMLSSLLSDGQCKIQKLNCPKSIVTCLVCPVTNKFSLSGCSESLMRLYNHTLQSSLTSWISTIFSGVQAKISFFDHGHTKTDFWIQSPSDISVAVATQLAFCYNRFWGNAFVVPGNTYATVYCYNVTLEAPTPDTLQYDYGFLVYSTGRQVSTFWRMLLHMSLG